MSRINQTSQISQMFDWAGLEEAAGEYPGIQLYPASPGELVFEERVKLNCFYCKNYNLNWKCPSRTPTVDYRKLMGEYGQGAFVKIELAFTEDTFSEIRTRSTNDLHRALLKLEKYLWERGYPLATSFIGGSCKLCKNGCGKERCNHPYAARMPLEAAGVNVVKSAEKYGISIVFPPREKLSRLGLLLW